MKSHRRGRRLMAENKDLNCGHCGKVVLAGTDLAAMEQMGGIGLNLENPALVKVLRRLGGDDYVECPHCHAMHAMVIHADLEGGPALWTLVGLKKIKDPSMHRYWEGGEPSGH